MATPRTCTICNAPIPDTASHNATDGGIDALRGWLT
jgi:hypothetical protein